jgi:prepilin-type processing-associated H-X9-DG protein
LPAREQHKHETQDGGYELGAPQAIGQMRLFLCQDNTARLPTSQRFPTSYVGVAGIGPDAATLSKEDRRAGIFGYDRETTPDDIKDGSSSTLLVIETARENGPWTAGGFPTVRGFDLGGFPALGPDGQFGGLHRGGCNACFADGSVRFLSESLDPRVFAAMTTMAGGEQQEP